MIEMTETFLSRGKYLNTSELLRDALREKIQKDAPDLYKWFSQGENAVA